MLDDGSETDINFYRQKSRYLRDKFHLRARSAKAKRGRKAQRGGLPGIRQLRVYEVVLREVYSR